MSVSIFSFFSGAGLLDLGFESEGYTIVLVNENKKDFLDSYIYVRKQLRTTKPQYGYSCCDIKEFLRDDALDLLRCQISEQHNSNNLVGFVGGPPCPDFSIAGKNKGKDGMNGHLAGAYVDLIIKCKPDFFVFENVKGLYKTEKHRLYYNALKLQLQIAGYYLADEVLNALSYGVPQDRQRIFLIGVREKHCQHLSIIEKENKLLDFPWLLYAKYDTNEVLDMKWPRPQVFWENSQRMFQYDVPYDLTVQFWFNRNNVTNHYNSKDCFRVRQGRKKMTTIKEGDTSGKSFKRLHRWKYSPTAAYGNNEVHLHPYKIRRISVSEALAIQTLPGYFRLPPDMSLTNKFKVIGNGVPYLMASNVARSLLKYLLEVPR